MKRQTHSLPDLAHNSVSDRINRLGPTKLKLNRDLDVIEPKGADFLSKSPSQILKLVAKTKGVSIVEH